ncbi:hypothetical protein [Curtobacterium sp. MCPF17_021]|uniref:hypothetical protein n=1 Tax=Curtobacterium sp. MCPF17_021 TaxID=2175639 RepID=UPI0015E8D02E|nr:hypothetical protein [Curtobacterium sp. MCPF17_021]WIE82569.1 hypothetical protein DEJ29_014415 [Curtobacterium sp. MCPF17_021]
MSTHDDRTRPDVDAAGRDAGTGPAQDDGRATRAVPAERGATQRETVLEREKEEFSGFKWGSAFFGWLTATGTALILTAILSAVGAGVGLGQNGGDVDDAAKDVTRNGDVVGIVGAIALAVILFVAYLCGGYVAGRMARFAGAKQGIAVWIWAVVIAVVVAVVTAVAGSQFNVLGNLNSFPRIPIDEGALTVTGIVTAVVVAIISLVGAVLGGVLGMRYHRRVDRVGLGR